MLLLGAAFAARADDCSAYPGGVLDGFAGTPAPYQHQDRHELHDPELPGRDEHQLQPSTTTTPRRYLVIFDNVVHTGQMACNAVAGHKIWFTNGSSTGIHEGCQNLFIPVEKIDKQNPAGQTTATIGVPFTYRLTIPILFDPFPVPGTVINDSGSLNDLHRVTVTDDLNATGAVLSYVSHTVYLEGRRHARAA